MGTSRSFYRTARLSSDRRQGRAVHSIASCLGGIWELTKTLTLPFSLAWAVFTVFEKVVLRLPWPLRRFVIMQFPDEFAAQQVVVRSRTLRQKTRVSRLRLL